MQIEVRSVFIWDRDSTLNVMSTGGQGYQLPLSTLVDVSMRGPDGEQIKRYFAAGKLDAYIALQYRIERIAFGMP